MTTNKLSLTELSRLSISELRKMAAAYSLPLRREMGAADIAALIDSHQRGPVERVVRVAEGQDRPAPGYARIEILRDSSPQASNSDVFLGVNGYCVQIKRGVKVDVPIKILRGSLMTSVVEVMREDNSQADPEKRYTWELVPSYPFTVYDVNEGPDPRDTYEKTLIRKNKDKRLFKQENGYWPKPLELREWKARRGRDNKEE